MIRVNLLYFKYVFGENIWVLDSPNEESAGIHAKLHL